MEPVAIVTGATRGIGQAVVRELSRHGLSCIAVGSSWDSARRVAPGSHLHFTTHSQRHTALAVDLAQWPQWTRGTRSRAFVGAVRTTARRGRFSLFPRARRGQDAQYVNLLVNCAGVTQRALSVNTPAEVAQRIVNVNLMSMFTLCNVATKHMIRAGRRRGSSLLEVTPSPCIINVSSLLGETGHALPGTSVYAATKAAITQYTAAIAQETATWGVRALSIAPGVVSDTDMVRGLDQAAREQLVQALMGLPECTTEDIARQVWSMYEGESQSGSL
ncbi:3-oxoacyl-[acyl-carrier-protein] reductase (NADPH) KNAG_0A07260 [Huiozyma naganishii CBS 8797]|uniref:Ketoreductase (KR) domain-containing protein n=1 Tax=Huiozyma naganishii (strain ATCC MYA-139 / BCRC 22969 / CBS 8797 / KCTC 17520 / NBRC 10181 / NCYC 3082 / Yp74L-3) TaxID=1071383 RepID=J7S2W3_HUIN7|nr:hypothetical protein KNAG_0A07260 [Kazachstania naganishii CBS 8797]CCK68379.1 hypothetical protein KNAG_0A07260 [Kazachstania naganishii CBS 8797]